MAKQFAIDYDTEDCTDTGYETITTCSKFYEWNARVQLTTWNPTSQNATVIPAGPIDYASKHWSGLIKDYYSERVKRLRDAFVQVVPNRPNEDLLKVKLAYEWTTATNAYPIQPVGDAATVSKTMHDKYSKWFVSCSK
jgi:hypothetical protein|tara:strand:- start:2727 stop:3140 length:414 start_codon:yes stop_codon:yes gene_type:complete